MKRLLGKVKGGNFEAARKLFDQLPAEQRREAVEEIALFAIEEDGVNVVEFIYTFSDVLRKEVELFTGYAGELHDLNRLDNGFVKSLICQVESYTDLSPALAKGIKADPELDNLLKERMGECHGFKAWHDAI